MLYVLLSSKNRPTAQSAKDINTQTDCQVDDAYMVADYEKKNEY